jgi:hypothetical protein
MRLMHAVVASAATWLVVSVTVGCNTSNFSGGSQKGGANKEETADAKPESTGLGTPADLDEPIVPADSGQSTPVATGTGVVATDIPADAVVQGSFTVWTVPADPAPAEPYTIMIEVRLPSNAVNYSVQDLSGMVIGTDGYEQPLGSSAGFLGEAMQNMTVGAGSARLSVMVPGAEQLVRDTIDVRSTLLNEQQRIELVF